MTQPHDLRTFPGTSWKKMIITAASVAGGFRAPPLGLAGSCRFRVVPWASPWVLVAFSAEQT